MNVYCSACINGYMPESTDRYASKCIQTPKVSNCLHLEARDGKDGELESYCQTCQPGYMKHLFLNMKEGYSTNTCVKATGEWVGCFMRDQTIDVTGKVARDECLGCDFYSGWTAKKESSIGLGKTG